MTSHEVEELIGYFMAALRAAVPAVTSEQRVLVREVLARMIREHRAVVEATLGASTSGRRVPTR